MGCGRGTPVGGEGLKWTLNLAAFAGMVALCVILFNAGGAGVPADCVRIS